MKKFILTPVLALVLCSSLVIQGCSTSWVTTLDDVLIAAAPALVNILNIIAIAENKPINVALEAKINADVATVKTLATDFANASAATSPAICAQLQAKIQVYAADEASVMQLANVTDPATQEKIAVLSSLVAGTVSAVLAVIPNCQQVTSAKLSAFRMAPPLPLKSFVSNYNAALVKKTGKVEIDKFTASHKIHVHSKLVRIVTLGVAE